MNLRDCIIYRKELKKREANYVPYPQQMHEDLKAFLNHIHIDALYSHQAEMFEYVMKQQNVVITTSTASGKTLSFLLPIVQEILQDPKTRAIFIYPTKALAADQLRAMQPMLDYFGESRISAGVYDGDTPPNKRSEIRKHANIILTNPEMLHGAFLANHSKFGFDFIFANLKYIVIDELHTYRGAFGSHIANVMKRCRRITNYYHSQPLFLCSSATIANPVELAENICGCPFTHVHKDGSPCGVRRYYIMQPPKLMGKDHKYLGQMQITSVAAQMIPGFVEKKRNFITFAKSRKNVEVIVKEARDKLESEHFLGKDLKDKISGYRGGYTPRERKRIEQDMIHGNLIGLVSTNALELGIDIGTIQTTILCGFPSTRASFWQQSGRSGRKGDLSNSFLILDQLPQDQYIGIHPEWLFENTSENAIIDADNLMIQLSHIRAAAAELPLTLQDISLFHDLGEAIPVLLRAKELQSQQGSFVWCGNPYPQGDFTLRNIDTHRYKLLHNDTKEIITEMDEIQAFREIHEGAIYMHDGMQYQIVKLDLESRSGYAISFQGNYYTQPSDHTNISIIKGMKEKDYQRTHAHFGDINVDTIVWMYKKLQFHNHQNLGYEQLQPPLSKEYETEGTWILIPEDVVFAYRNQIQVNDRGKEIRNNHFEGLCHALLTAANMVTMSEKEDIGAVMSSNASGMSKAEVYLFLYDKYVGGLGYSEKVYDLLPEIIQCAITLVKGCICDDGCIVCCGDHHLDKALILWGLESLLAECDMPEDIKHVHYAPSVFMNKSFQLASLPLKWEAFCSYLKEMGDSYADVLSSVKSIAVEQESLTLYTSHRFYQDWMLEEHNYRSLKNIISYYVEVPDDFHLMIKQLEHQDHEDQQDKLVRRYKNVKDLS